MGVFEDEEFEDGETMLVELEDDEGNSQSFEVVLAIEYDDKEYVVLLPAETDEEETPEVTILESVDDETMCGIDDDELLDELFEIFKQECADSFEFVDE